MGLKHLNDSKAFIECSNDRDDVYKNIGECNPSKKRKILIAFDDMIADMLSNKMKHLLSNEAKEQKDVLLGMFLGTLGVLINLFSGKGVTEEMKPQLEQVKVQLEILMLSGFLILPNTLNNFEMQKYYQNESKFTGVIVT